MSLSPTLELSMSLLTFLWGDCPWHFRHFLFLPLFGLTTSRLIKLCLFVISTWGFTRFVFCFHSMCSFNIFHQILFFQLSSLSSSEFTSSFSLGVSTTTPNKGCKCTNRWCWTMLYGPNPYYPTETWVVSSCIGSFISLFKDMPFFFACTTTLVSLDRALKFFKLSHLQVHFCWLPFPCLS
jgi:hypothetical protein